MKTFDYRFKNQTNVSSLLAIIAALLFFVGFAPVSSAKGVTTETVRTSDLGKGKYTLISYGTCLGSENPSAVAFLQKEGTPYTFKFLAPGFTYDVTSGLSAHDALVHAQDFVKCNASYQNTALTKITGPDGSILGYEVKPVVRPIRYGSLEPYDTRYTIEGDKLLTSVTVDPQIQLSQMEGGY